LGEKLPAECEVRTAECEDGAAAATIPSVTTNTVANTRAIRSSVHPADFTRSYQGTQAVYRDPKLVLFKLERAPDRRSRFRLLCCEVRRQQFSGLPEFHDATLWSTPCNKF